MSDASLTRHENGTPARSINLGNTFDLALPMAARSEGLWYILELAAHLSIERDEQDTDAYDDPVFRGQEVKRRILKGIIDLGEITHMLEVRWTIENSDERWLDSDGAEIGLKEVLESQMPNEEQRKSSGRARELWSFRDTAHKFHEQGIPDQRIAECNKSGMKSVLGMVANAQRKLEAVTPPNELREVYDTLIQAASETTRLQDLEKQIRVMIDPTDTPPPPIPYSVEVDGDYRWVVARPTNEQFRDLVLRRLSDVLETDKQLPEWFARYWREGVPVGQGDTP